MYQQGHQLDVWGEGAALHHIGLAMAHIEDIALSRLETVIDPIQKVKIAFVQMNDCCVELLEPLGADSPIVNSLKKNNKLLHLCFEVFDLAKALDAAGTHGFRIVKKPVPAAAFSGRYIAWVFSPLWGLIELLEREKKL